MIATENPTVHVSTINAVRILTDALYGQMRARHLRNENHYPDMHQFRHENALIAENFAGGISYAVDMIFDVETAIAIHDEADAEAVTIFHRQFPGATLPHA